VRLTSGQPANIASVQLPAGSWHIWGELWFDTSQGPTNVSWLGGAISQMSATFPADPSDGMSMTAIEPNSAGPLMTNSNVLNLAPVNLRLPSPLEIYVVAQANWSGNGYLSAYGKIAAYVK